MRCPRQAMSGTWCTGATMTLGDLSRARQLAIAVTLLAILAVTLFPSGDEKLEPMLRCLVCGERGVADVIINVILFVPFGAALGVAGTRLLRVCLVGALFSGAIELAQLFVPGRDSSLSDVLSNTTGAAVGYALARYTPRIVGFPTGAATLASAGAATLPALVIAATGLLLRPALPHSIYYGQWTPNLGHLEWYRGYVLAARLGTVELPPRRLTNSDTVRALLLAGAPLRVAATAGPEVPALASLVSVYDEYQREIFLLGPDRHDLVVRYRTRATAWRLDQPDLRISDALTPIRSGDTLTITLWRQAAGYCVLLNDVRTCRLNFSAGHGWAMLLYPESFPAWLRWLLNAGWLGGLLLPVGYCARSRRVLWIGGALLVSLGVMPPLVGLLPTSLAEWLGGLTGAAVGTRLRALATAARAAPR